MDTNERLAVLETNTGNIKDDVQEIKDVLNEHVKRDDLLDKRFASKWVEYIVTTLIIGGALALFGVFIQKI